MPLLSEARRLATSALHHRIPRGVALRLIAAAGRDLVLVYHRVAPGGEAAHEIVRSLPSALLRQQLEALAIIGQIVPLARLLEAPPATGRPRFAITFDDDDVGHVRNALPVLQSVGAPATFFLSGRALHGLPPYWWTLIEHGIRTRGFAYTRGKLGLNALKGDKPADLAVALEGAPLTAQMASVLPVPDEPAMSADDIRTLADAGMTIGFHTLHHPVLSLLEGAELETAMRVGRREVAAAAGTRVDLLAYPYGRANAAVAEAANRAAFTAAWATGGRPTTHRSHHFMLGRWEPDTLAGDDFVAAVALRLLRFPTPSQSSPAKPTE